ncbi:hypothetical protein LCGC14_2264250 [marine sediment metagenome]|uniref:Uncharacterized protein n=1 Tax=marine sediment metagenome TaxID=412755 RepID=A0A0F9CZ13_9ZZZZ
MKSIIYEDKEGFLHRVLIKNNDPLTAAEYGLPVGPPDVRDIDWDLMMRQINNVLVEHEIFDWYDAQRKPVGLTAALTIFKRHLISLYRLSDTK